MKLKWKQSFLTFDGSYMGFPPFSSFLSFYFFFPIFFWSEITTCWAVFEFSILIFWQTRDVNPLLSGDSDSSTQTSPLPMLAIPPL